jgi:Pentapeptide repeats (8 copies)
LWLNQFLKSRQQRSTEQRAEIERKAAEQYVQSEHEIAADNQREAALQGYIDHMSELLLHEHLRTSAPQDEVIKIARVRTVTVLARLDAIRKRSVLQFLYESDLIHKDKGIFHVNGAALMQALLSRADLRAANLSGAYLSGADLSGADLGHADLSEALLGHADLSEASLRAANLRAAFLRAVNLSKANLKEAVLIQALLGEANLTGANLTGATLVNAQVTS